MLRAPADRFKAIGRRTQREEPEIPKEEDRRAIAPEAFECVARYGQDHSAAHLIAFHTAPPPDISGIPAYHRIDDHEGFSLHEGFPLIRGKSFVIMVSPEITERSKCRPLPPHTGCGYTPRYAE